MTSATSQRSPLATLLAPALALVLSAPASATVCPTATFDQILALGNCTIAGSNFDFTQRQLPSHPVWNNGPFAGNTKLAPDAAAVVFTPDSSPGSIGFTLAMDFGVVGQASRFDPFAQTVKTGNYIDATLAYFSITNAAGMGLSGYSVTMGNVVVTQTSFDAIVYANLNSATAAVNNAGFTRLTEAIDYGAVLPGTLIYAANLKAYEYSPDAAHVAGFGTVSFEFAQQALAVPEPETALLWLAGLAGIACIARRRTG
ncbi:PEP-CTERM sorting domain-containing protein [Roseateles sp. P5_E1]